ncbi:HAMP domain-containing sensor histidine kinase [Chryseomicrobium sp. FSL W7-1435]|uniref:sensor histidine kinase n=1 Tax=Chryseomicrobium sp. FSL W7-1435 TaxID=2921704 RepID=UPI0031599CD7
MKLKAKIHLFSTVVAVVTLVVVNGLSYYLFEQFSYSNASAPLRNDVQQVAAAFTDVTDVTQIPTVLRAYVPENGALRIVDGDSLISSIETVEGLYNYRTTIAASEPYTRTENDSGTILSVSTTALLGTGEVVTIELHQQAAELDAMLALLFRTFLIATVLGAVLLFTSNFILGRQVTAPIERLIGHMRSNREQGTYQVVAVEEDKKDEPAQMSREFNAMMEKLEENYVKQEQFVSNAAHELKTPLTIIESYANLLKRRGTADVHVTAEAIEAITSETERMKWLIEQFLELARSQQSLDVELEELDVVPLVTALVEQLQRVYGRDIQLSSPEKVMHKTDPARLRQLLTVIIDNAQKYSEQPIRIDIDMQQIRIRDEGEGIPQSAIPHLFDRFYRVDQARTRSKGGSGIGLAIAKELATQLAMTIEVQSKEGVGTTVLLTFD